MMDFRARAFEEHVMLGRRVSRIRGFLESAEYAALPEVDRQDLREQLKHMEGYYTVLSRRVKRMSGNS